MLTLFLLPMLMMVCIVLSSYLFSNAVEHCGQAMKLSAGAAASLVAAIATALPETLMPVLALLGVSTETRINEEVTTGAILGAPLMLSTLSTLLMCCSVLKKRGIGGRITPERQGFVRDLNFFLLAFSMAALTMYLPDHLRYARVSISVGLIMLYAYYVKLTLAASRQAKQQGQALVTEDPLLLTKLGLAHTPATMVCQLFVGLGMLLLAAEQFIHGIVSLAASLQVSTLLVSLLIIPIATELPEKVNSILWLRHNKDTLAFGNITGAMVFQGTLLPALGIFFTPWVPTPTVLVSVALTLLAALWLRVNASPAGVPMRMLFLNGGFYLLFLYVTLAWR